MSEFSDVFNELVKERNEQSGKKEIKFGESVLKKFLSESKSLHFACTKTSADSDPNLACSGSANKFDIVDIYDAKKHTASIEITGPTTDGTKHKIKMTLVKVSEKDLKDKSTDKFDPTRLSKLSIGGHIGGMKVE